MVLFVCAEKVVHQLQCQQAARKDRDGQDAGSPGQPAQGATTSAAPSCPTVTSASVAPHMLTLCAMRHGSQSCHCSERITAYIGNSGR